MAFHPINTLINGGITELAIVIGNHGGDAVKTTIGDGSRWPQLIKPIQYFTQIGDGGIADALKLVKPFYQNTDKLVVCLGDNIFEDEFDFTEIINKANGKAVIFLKSVDNPERFGVAQLDTDNKIINIIEKPATAVSNLAVTGLYIYPTKNLFNIIDSLKPSNRNELEITDVNNSFLKNNNLAYSIIENSWCDGGSIDSLLYANILMASKFYDPKHIKKFNKILAIL